VKQSIDGPDRMSCAESNLLKVIEHEWNRERFGFEKRLLSALRVLCDESKISFLLEVGFNGGNTSASRVADSLDEQALSNAEFDTHIVRA
jgi:hypothetical protein